MTRDLSSGVLYFFELWPPEWFLDNREALKSLKRVLLRSALSLHSGGKPLCGVKNAGFAKGN